MLNAVTRWYLTRFPLQKGKWHIWTMIQSMLDRSPAEVEVRVREGWTMRLTLSEEVDRLIYFWGAYEPNESWIIQQVLRDGDTFVDIGANIGYFTLLGSRCVGSYGRVIAFEACPDTASRLAGNLERNNVENVIVHAVALGDQDRMVRIGRIYAQNAGMNTLRCEGRALESWQVPMRRLDDILEGTESIRLVKMDIEGAELMALRGFERGLRAPDAPDILCEVTDRYLRDLGGCAEDLMQVMRDCGYSAFAFRHKTGKPVSAGDLRSCDQMNVLFTRRQDTASRLNLSLDRREAPVT
jgi:FkbM family methyltransferase